MGMRPSKGSFLSTLGRHVAATELTPMPARHLHPERREVDIFLEEVDERVTAPLASKKVSNYAFDWVNPPANVYIY